MWTSRPWGGVMAGILAPPLRRPRMAAMLGSPAGPGMGELSANLTAAQWELFRFCRGGLVVVWLGLFMTG